MKFNILQRSEGADAGQTANSSATVVDLLYEFYIAAARAGLVKVDASTLRASLEGSALVTEGLIDEDFLDDLSCVTCLTVCFPPVFSCVSGHLICDNCKKYHVKTSAELGRIASCPVCRNDVEYPMSKSEFDRVLNLLLKSAPTTPKVD